MGALDMALDDVIKSKGKPGGGRNSKQGGFRSIGPRRVEQKVRNTERRRTTPAASAFGPAMKAAAAAAKAAANPASKPGAVGKKVAGEEKPAVAPKTSSIAVPSKAPKGSDDKMSMSLDEMITSGRTKASAKGFGRSNPQAASGREKLGAGRLMKLRRTISKPVRPVARGRGAFQAPQSRAVRERGGHIFEGSWREGFKGGKGSSFGRRGQVAQKRWIDDEEDWGPGIRGAMKGRGKGAGREESWGWSGKGKGKGYDAWSGPAWGPPAWGPSRDDWGARPWPSAPQALTWDRPPVAPRSTAMAVTTSRAAMDRERPERTERVVERAERPAKATRAEEKPERPKAQRTVRVCNVPRNLDSRDIKEAFEDNGPVLRCEVERGVAIITFENAADAKKAVQTFDRGELNGQTIFVSLEN